MPTVKPKGAKAPFIIHNENKFTGAEWFQWYKDYLMWLHTTPAEQLRLLELIGLTEHYYSQYVNPLTK